MIPCKTWIGSLTHLRRDDGRAINRTYHKVPPRTLCGVEAGYDLGAAGGVPCAGCIVAIDFQRRGWAFTERT